jgi:hypothetical protein
VAPDVAPVAAPVVPVAAPVVAGAWRREAVTCGHLMARALGGLATPPGRLRGADVNMNS